MPAKKARRKNEFVPEKAMTSEEKYQNFWAMLVIVLLTILIYSNSLRNGFIYFDDPELVIDNLAIRQITWDNFVHYFTTPVQFTYLPMGLISYAIDYQIGKLDPFIYHLDSLIFHLLTVVLVFWVFLLLTRKSRIAIFVALLFAIHPVNVDGVAWVATRNNILATFFYLGALLFYSFYIKRNFQLRYLVLACISFILSDLSKSASVVLPLTLFLWDYFYGRKWDKKLLIEKIPFFVIALFFGIMTLNIRGDVVPPVQYNLFDRLILFCFSMVDYFVRLLFPLQLSMSYAYPVKDGGFLPLYYYLSPFILGLIIWGLYKLNGSRKVLIVGLGFFFVNIFLSQSVLLEDNFMASRYAYLSYLGLFLILADFNERILDAPTAPNWESKLKIAWVALLVVFVAGFSVLTYSRNFVWKDTITLFDDVVAKQPNQAWVYSNRGIAKYKNNDFENALKDFNQALVLDPNFTLSLYYRGVLSYLSNDYDAALVDLNRTIVNTPTFSNAYNDRGNVKLALQDKQGALADFSEAIRLNSYFLEAYFSRGMLEADLGQYQQAIADFDAVISLSPEYAEAYFRRSTAKRNLNDTTGSCDDAAKAASLGYQPAPDSTDPNCP